MFRMYKKFFAGFPLIMLSMPHELIQSFASFREGDLFVIFVLKGGYIAEEA